MVQVGEEVVTMGAPGRFTVVIVDGNVVTIENAEGMRKTVLDWNVRSVDKPRSSQS